MAADDSPLPRLMSFVSQEELDHAKQTRGERVEDGTAQRDRPLYEILRENKDKKDAEFNERFKHRPPKALDEDETEFLDKLEMSKKEYERKQAMEEADQLRSFQDAVAARSSIVHEIKETPVSGPELVQEYRPAERKNQKTRPLGLIVSVKPQLKKAKTETPLDNNSVKVPNGQLDKKHNGQLDKKHPNVSTGALGSLVSYSDESEDDS